MKKKYVGIVLILLLILSAFAYWWLAELSKNQKQNIAKTDNFSSSDQKIVGSNSAPDRLREDESGVNKSQEQSTSPENSANSSPSARSSQAERSLNARQTNRPKNQPQSNSQTQPNGGEQSPKPTPPTADSQQPSKPTPPAAGNQQPLAPPTKSEAPTQPAPTPAPQPPVQNPPVPTPLAQNPPTPAPQPPKPTPPTVPTDEEKARRLAESLKSPHNNNVAQFVNDQGQIRTVLWVDGINAPKLGENGDFVREETVLAAGRYVDYVAPYKPGVNWYDIDKSFATEQDANLCFAAVAGNMLHWWYDRNAQNIDRLLAQRSALPPNQANTFKDLAIYKNSFNSQQQSKFFDMYKIHFGYNQNGFFTDLLVDLFINGHTPKPSGGTNENWEYMDDFKIDPRGGLFYDVFGKKPLTDRTFGGSYSGLNRQLRNILREGKIAGLAYTVLGRTTGHIVTLWGAEFDLGGNLVGVYITDSDDKDYKLNGMKRYNVYNNGGKSIISNNLTNRAYGSSVDYIHILSPGKSEWQNYFNSKL